MVTTFGGAGLVAGVAFGPVAGASAASARPKTVVPHLTHPKVNGSQALPSWAKGKIGRSVPAVNATPDIPSVTPSSKTFTVNTTNDASLTTPSSTTCKAKTATKLCTLRAAIEAADNDHGHVDTIKVPAGTYLLKTGPITIDNSMLIDGAGSTTTAVSGQKQFEVFDIFSKSVGFEPAVEISGLNIEDGSTNTSGGDIYDSDSALTLSATTVSDGDAGLGGGIFLTQGALWADGSTKFTSNTATTAGGAIFSTLSGVFLGGTTLSGNTSGTAGGAILQLGALVSEGATYSGNSARYGGGAIYNVGSMSDTGSTYTDNSVTGVTTETTFGGVIDNVWDATLSGVTVSSTTNKQSNVRTMLGGVFFNGDQLTLDNVTVSGTTNSCAHCDIAGGVVFSEVTTIARRFTTIDSSSLTVTGLTVTGTSNGTATGHPQVEGGVILNAGSHATLAGLTISKTTNVTNTDDFFGGVLSGYDWTHVSGWTISGTSDTVHGRGEVAGVVGLTTHSNTQVTGLSISDTTVTAGGGSTVVGAIFDGTGDTVSTLANVNVTGTSVTVTGGFVTGALYAGGSLGVRDTSISDTTVRDVGATGEVGGGGWFNVGALTADGVQVLGTTVTTDREVYGGAFAVVGNGPVTMTNSTFAGTSVTETGTEPVYGAIAGFTEGAALTNVTMDDSTVSVPAKETASLVDLETSVQFTNDTIANDALSSSTGGAFTGTVGGLMMTGTYSAGFKNTIVSTSPTADSCSKAGHTKAAFVSAGGNIDSGTSCGFTQASDQDSTTPMVAKVANNTGPVETAALEPGSPAIGRGVSAGCPATDARGVARPAGDCDVGAFQVSGQGYWEVASDGGIFTFGTATFHGSMGGIPLNAPVVGMAVTPDRGGYWEVASDGGVFAFGSATYYGSMGGRTLNAPIVAIAATPTGKGYWEVASDGGIFAFGSAVFYGSMGGVHLNAPVVGIAAVPTGKGYWEVAADGGIFAFGSAGFYTSMGGRHLNAPVVGIAAAPTGKGYWEVAADGGIFNFGSAGFYTSMGGKALVAPVVGIANAPTGKGYWEFAADGGVFSFGTAKFQGSMGGIKLVAPVVGGAGFERL